MTHKLVIVGGVPGSGKSHFGKEICKGVPNSVFVDKDTISNLFTGALLESLGSKSSDRESETYLAQVRGLEYRTMLSHALENLELQRTVICSAPFIKEITSAGGLDEVSYAARLTGASVMTIWVNVDEKTARERIIERRSDRDEWKLANWDAYVSRTRHAIPEGAADLLILDNSACPEVPVAEKLRFIIDSIIKGS